ncbi:MAG: hypothetical protein FWG30_08960 [Eubacteriaceae bacterium]|nr:hypothetical protein [Eubacteriaceae bacterium]
MEKIIKRIQDELGDNGLAEKLLALSKSDLTSLLLYVFEKQETNPAGLLRAFQTNRFARPSDIDPIAYRALETELLAVARDIGIKPVLLSPAALLGSCSAFGYVSQNNVLSSVRSTEALSDPTNMLAIIIADDIMQKKIDNITPVHYCATARVVRAQAFPAAKDLFAHFGLFCIASSGKDTGSYACETELFAKQMGYYKELFSAKRGSKLTVELRRRRGYKDSDGFYEAMAKQAESVFGIAVERGPANEDNNYYLGINYKIYMENGASRYVAVDGGFVDWTQRLANNKKERCLISGMGIDRLLL